MWNRVCNAYARACYAKWLHTLPIEEHTVLLESSHGVTANGNIWYILKELTSNPRYRDYTLYMTTRVNNQAAMDKRLAEAGMGNVKTVPIGTKAYFRVLASAKYLINDTTFYPFFVKRKGQVYGNTWHGTPLKTLGKRVHNDLHNIGNVQKNFLFADYLLYPNTYTMEHIREDYMLDNLATGTCLLGGYPRNTAFFDTALRERMRARLGVAQRRVYAYMPTWRGTVGRADRGAGVQLQEHLTALDAQLTDDEVMWVSIHPLAHKNVDLTAFAHIRPFPDNCETNEVLAATDCLITDYSSVLYDFAVTHRPIVLFAYDEEQYCTDRGLYCPLSSLPFPSVSTVDDLIFAIRRDREYDDTAFLAEYCPYDSADATAHLCARIFFGETEGITERAMAHNNKQNVLLYAGNLSQNGLTASIMNLLSHIDRSAYNVYIAFSTRSVAARKEVLTTLPDGVGYIAMTGTLNLTLLKKIVWMLFLRKMCPFWLMMCVMKGEFRREFRRRFGDARIDHAVQFTGYETPQILLFSEADANRIIYVHSDMLSEIRTRGNQRKAVLRYAYNTYDHVAIVTDDLRNATCAIGGKGCHPHISHNLIAHKQIRQRGELPLIFDTYTRCNHSQEHALALLASDAYAFVNVGRFSPEKGQRGLVDAFVRLHAKHPDTCLFIVGGNTNKGMYNELCAYVQTLPCADRIVLILSMSNPLPLVKRCKGFVLSSHYEGFGLALVEADVLGLPVVATDITGPRTFMQAHGGVLIDDSDAGLDTGLLMLYRGEVPHLNVDYEAYNRKAMAEFESMLTERKETV